MFFYNPTFKNCREVNTFRLYLDKWKQNLSNMKVNI
jgi:hypothetical protein